ncbi:16S rRNA (cytosine(1402)-N(4))-methyltransferase [Periweissella cryptocerci]|uniref:16S rRNA (Cytosine(1402)-N(4))-methyltransferase n=1 Tax=Periweissella cryptocerci TaxID=2506420 RepID=A0A4P6YV65_9LACO|nr:class I SAM-dependent methyltransferase [Periweissella cryptocerci]QBO36670.1 16S rRNA (cytosine(1402)-N(4))-methyltransferase [Periweissella cryptocerci]
MKLENALNYSHTLLQQVVQPGEFVIDATVGNGYDTEFLARLVGPIGGRVLGFDVQLQAIEHTTDRLDEAGITNTQLIHKGHEHVGEYLTDQEVAGAIFNLGYLPGADKSVITHGNTTLEAVSSILPRLRKEGLLVLVVYYGHPGGETELNAVMDYVEALPHTDYNVLQYGFINQENQPPFVLAIQKR